MPSGMDGAYLSTATRTLFPANVRLNHQHTHQSQGLDLGHEDINTSVEGHGIWPHSPIVGPSSYTLNKTGPVPFQPAASLRRHLGHVEYQRSQMGDGAICVEADDSAGLNGEGVGDGTLEVSDGIDGEARDGGLVEAVNRPGRVRAICGPLAAVYQTWVHDFRQAPA